MLARSIGALSLATICTLVCSAPVAWARGGGGGHSYGSHSSGGSHSFSPSSHSSGSSSGSGGSVHVGGYTRKDGTYVHSYTRHEPGEGSSSHSLASVPKQSSTLSHPSTSAAGARDSHGKIKRSEAERDAFLRQHPCPATGKTSGACPGYVVDHVTPLKRGGADNPSNMQWQTADEAKAKDKWE